MVLAIFGHEQHDAPSTSGMMVGDGAMYMYPGRSSPSKGLVPPRLVTNTAYNQQKPQKTSSDAMCPFRAQMPHVGPDPNSDVSWQGIPAWKVRTYLRITSYEKRMFPKISP